MSGPCQTLYIYEVEGTFDPLPPGWKQKGLLGCWYEAGYSFLFFSCPSRGLVEEEAKRSRAMKVRSETVIPYEDWEAGTHLRPFAVGPLWVAPPWASREISGALIIDPVVSFGSGFHGSTRACLELLVYLYGKAAPQTVLDLGTGSGILALAAARLGAGRVLAVDCQPVAVETASANVKRNRLDEKVDVRLGNALEFLEEPADLILANLHLELLMDMATRSSLWRKPWCILAGVVGRQARRLLDVLQRTPMELVQSREEGPWSGFLLAGHG
jgi:ribosomal protein L11 methyltransferase